MNDAPLTDEELRNALFPLRTNKCPGYDHISFNAINSVFDFIVEPLMYIVNNSLAREIFLDEMKIAPITPIYNGGFKENVVHYRPIYVLRSFSKMLERIAYNRLCSYLTEKDLLYNKQIILKSLFH